jgi:hypothetical protein
MLLQKSYGGEIVSKRADQYRRERVRQLRGLVLLVLAALLFAVLRAGVGRVFTPGWWRLW